MINVDGLIIDLFLEAYENGDLVKIETAVPETYTKFLGIVDDKGKLEIFEADNTVVVKETVNGEVITKAYAVPNEIIQEMVMEAQIANIGQGVLNILAGI